MWYDIKEVKPTKFFNRLALKNERGEDKSRMNPAHTSR